MSENHYSEEWRPVAGYEGIYSVSSFGRIRRDARGPRTRPGKILLLRVSNSGYLVVRLYSGSRNKHAGLLVHRLVAQAFIINHENRREVNHKNGIKVDNSVSNLEWMTSSQNQLHAFACLGKKAMRGENHVFSKLKAVDIKTIMLRLANGETQRKIAASYGIHQSQISLIKNKKAYITS